jgi:hypothetical protein
MNFSSGHVRNGHPNQVVGVASHQIALHHLVMLGDALLKLGQCGFGLLFQADGNKKRSVPSPVLAAG